MYQIDCSDEADWARVTAAFPMLRGLPDRLFGTYRFPLGFGVGNTKRRPLKIVLMGTMGAGKSTLLRAMGQPSVSVENEAEMFNYSGYSLISESLRDPSEAGPAQAILSEIAAANIRRAQMSDPECVIQERGVIDNMIVWRALIDWSLRSATLKELALYAFVVTYMTLFASYDCRVIYLRGDPAEQFARVKARGSPRDDEMSREFHSFVTAAYDAFADRIAAGGPCEQFESIDATNLSREEVAERAASILARWREASD